MAHQPSAFRPRASPCKICGKQLLYTQWIQVGLNWLCVQVRKSCLPTRANSGASPTSAQQGVQKISCGGRLRLIVSKLSGRCSTVQADQSAHLSMVGVPSAINDCADGLPVDQSQIWNFLPGCKDRPGTDKVCIPFLSCSYAELPVPDACSVECAARTSSRMGSDA